MVFLIQDEDERKADLASGTPSRVKKKTFVFLPISSMKKKVKKIRSEKKNSQA